MSINIVSGDLEKFAKSVEQVEKGVDGAAVENLIVDASEAIPGASCVWSMVSTGEAVDKTRRLVTEGLTELVEDVRRAQGLYSEADADAAHPWAHLIDRVHSVPLLGGGKTMREVV